MYSLFDYGQMLADNPRCEAYSKAILASVRPGDAVLEIGCALDRLRRPNEVGRCKRAIGREHHDVAIGQDVNGQHGAAFGREAVLGSHNMALVVAVPPGDSGARRLLLPRTACGERWNCRPSRPRPYAAPRLLFQVM